MTTTAVQQQAASTAGVQEPSGLEEDISQLSGHTIMLVQFSSNEETRTFIDCQNPYDAMETFCRIYENFLLNKKGLLPNRNQDEEMEEEVQRKAREDTTEYRLEDILKFVDQLYDLSAMTYNERAFGFTAHGKAWFKGKIHAYLRKLASSEAQ